MFITRATRRDAQEIKDFYMSQGWAKVDPAAGVAYIARLGPIIGCLRLIELDPQKLVVQDVVVDQSHRGTGVGRRLLRAAMNARGGTLYAVSNDDGVGFFERHGFTEVSFDDLPEKVKRHVESEGNTPDTPGALAHYLKAR